MGVGVRDVARGIVVLTSSLTCLRRPPASLRAYLEDTYLPGGHSTHSWYPGLTWRTASCSVKTNPTHTPAPTPTPTPTPNLEDHVVVSEDDEGVVGRRAAAQVPVRGVGGRSSALGRALERWRAASKGPGPLPGRRGSALAHDYGRGGRVVLPLARAAAVSTG